MRDWERRKDAFKNAVLHHRLLARGRGAATAAAPALGAATAAAAAAVAGLGLRVVLHAVQAHRAEGAWAGGAAVGRGAHHGKGMHQI